MDSNGEARARRGLARRWAALLAGCVVVLLGRAVIGADVDAVQTPPSEPLLDGRRLFEEKGCSQCHAVRRDDGVQRAGPDLGHASSWRDVSQFTGALWNHIPTMLASMSSAGLQPPRLTSDEMGKIVAYLFYVNFLDEPGDVARGREAFEQRGCARCHQLGGRGGTSGPRLDELKGHASAFFLAQALWNHGPEMAVKMAEKGIPRPPLEAADINDMVALLRGESRGAGAAELAYAQGGSPRAGKALFQAKGCMKCHAVAGEGGNSAPDLAVRRTRARASDIAAAMWNHGPPMWAKMKEMGMAFFQLSDSEVANLFSYLSFVQYVGEKGDAARGATVFRERGCADCHAVAGEGGKVGPDLATTAAAQKPVEWATGLWNHAAGMDAKAREAKKAWPQFAGDEMRDLMEFVRSRHRE